MRFSITEEKHKDIGLTIYKVNTEREFIDILVYLEQIILLLFPIMVLVDLLGKIIRKEAVGIVDIIATIIILIISLTTERILEKIRTKDYTAHFVSKESAEEYIKETKKKMW